MDKDKTSLLDDNNLEIYKGNEGGHQRRFLLFSFNTFFQLTSIIIFSLFFVVIYFLLDYHSKIIINQSDLQLQAEVSDKIYNEFGSYLLSASEQLQTVHNILSNDKVFSKGFNEEVFLSIIRDIVSRDSLKINALYFGDEKGNFYMAKHIGDGLVSVRIVKNNGRRIVERWKHKAENSRRLSREYKPLVVSSLKDGYDPRKRGWYKNATDGEIRWTNPYIFFTDNLLGVTASRRISNKGIRGVVGVDLSLEYLNKFLKNLSFSQLGNIVITDFAKNVIALSDKNNLSYEKNFKEVTVNKKIVPRFVKVEEIDSSEEMSFLARGIPLLSENKLIKTSIKDKNFLDVILSVFFPKYSKGENIQSLLQKGLITGIITYSDNEYVYTYRALRSLPGISWQIYTFANQINVNPTPQYITKIVLWLFLILMIVFIYTLYYSSKVITKPLSAVVNLMLNLKELKLDKRFTYPTFLRISEVRNIGNVYNDLNYSLSAFKKFVPDTVIKQSLNSSKELSVSMKKKKNLSVLFSDIEEFTTITEKNNPKILCQCLEIYFSEMVSFIKKNGGAVDKFIGDAIMAIFGGFDDAKKSAEEAVRAALLMQLKSKEINEKIKTISNNIEFKTRIGINTGDVMMGILGSSEYLSFTVIGDSVNLASRLEGANKAYGSQIIVSEFTKRQTEKSFVYKLLDKLQVKGKSEFVEIYQLIGEKKSVSKELKMYVEEYTILKQYMISRNLKEAKKQLVFIESNFDFIQDPLLADIKKKIKRLK